MMSWISLLARLRLKEGGGHGGHNGLRDIASRLGNKNFMRLRIGIDHPGHKDRVTPYVLGKPSRGDFDKIIQGIFDAMAVTDDLIQGEFDRAFRYLHNRD